MPDGETIFLDDTNLVGSPEYSRQCTADADIFAVGQLHSGTAKITVRMPEFRREQLRGGTLRLRFKVDNADDWVPLGEWTITEPSRRERDFIEIVAEDCISQLDVPINDRYVGMINISARMKKVTELTGVRFAQTAEEIEALMNVKYQPVAGTSFCRNCREEVSSIARFIGGIAYADRNGKIAFRRFGTEPVLTIHASRRHKASLAEYTFSTYSNGVEFDLYNCVLNGDLIGGYLIGNGTLMFYYSYLILNTYDTSKLPHSLYMHHSICSVNHESPRTSASSNDDTSIYGNDFILKGTYGYIIHLSASSCKRGIIDMSMSSESSVRPSVSGDCEQSLIVINTDKIKVDDNVKIIRATTAQLRDPAALKELGFPIRSIQNE